MFRFAGINLWDMLVEQRTYTSKSTDLGLLDIAAEVFLVGYFIHKYTHPRHQLDVL